MKSCTKCLRELPIAEFWVQLKGVGGRTSICPACQYSLYKTSPYARHSTLRTQAKRRGLTVTITADQLAFIRSCPCTYCGRALTETTGYGLDRVDNTQDYTIGNIVPCCSICNVMRSTYWTYDEFKQIGAVLSKLNAVRQSAGLPLSKRPSTKSRHKCELEIPAEEVAELGAST